MKDLLRHMQLVQMTVPCTDGHRTKMRHQMRSLQVWAGLPLAFFTLNPADVKHPLTLYYSLDSLWLREILLPGVDSELQQLLSRQQLGRSLRRIQSRR